MKNIIDSLPAWFSNENDIQKDLAKVMQVDRYDITCSDKDDKKRN
jgi:hypothetical protein